MNDPASVRESGQSIARVAGGKFLRLESGYAVIEVGSGQYAFTSR
jgi:hypothetical protein